MENQQNFLKNSSTDSVINIQFFSLKECMKFSRGFLKSYLIKTIHENREENIIVEKGVGEIIKKQNNYRDLITKHRETKLM